MRHGLSVANYDVSLWDRMPDHSFPLHEKGKKMAVEAGKAIAEYYKMLKGELSRDREEIFAFVPRASSLSLSLSLTLSFLAPLSYLFANDNSSLLGRHSLPFCVFSQISRTLILCLSLTYIHAHVYSVGS